MALKIATVNVQGKVANQVRLGKPTSGSFQPGLVVLDELDSVVDTLDDMNVAALDQAERDGGDIAVGTPTDGSYTGQEPIQPTDLIADAVDSINDGLKNINDTVAALLDRVGWTRIVGITNLASTPAPTYVDPPNNTILETASVTSTTFDVTVEAAFPLVEVNSVPATLALVGAVYRGVVGVTLAVSGPVVVETFDPDGNPAAEDTIAVTLDLPPTILTGVFTAGYPGIQTELKEADTFQLQITANEDFDQVIVQDFDACSSATIGVPTASSATVTVTIADRGDSAQLLGARVQVRDAVTGGLSEAFDTDSAGSVDGTNVVNLNNLNPTLTLAAPGGYPGAQEALKGAEGASVGVTIANADTVDWTSTPGHLSITNPNETGPGFDASKTVARIGGTYNVAGDGGVANLQGSANRAANDSTTLDAAVVNIANVAATVTVSEATARVRSGPAPGNDTTITISGDQELISAPSLDPAASRGTFQGAGFAGGPKTWTRALRVPDSQNPATGAANTWINLSCTNLAGILTTAITGNDTYVIGGFTQRTLNYPAFTAVCTETFPLTTEGNLSVGSFSNGNPGVVKVFGTPDTTTVGREGWCAPTAASGVAVSMRMLHSPSVAANSGGLTLSTVEEVA